MSSVDKLMIQGIRSFGSTDEQKAIIQFFSPLTLITGQNGAGKTTIIECMKYITTGDLPPNSKGGAFVHDPKLIGEREVKGVVKLRFKDMAGNLTVCHRMLQSIQKPRKIEQRTLDASIERIVDGTKRKITTRCGEIDREMIDSLGVSKAILNHVIFCHQEESHWPLSEGRALKSKFDEIFASTRYTKALESIKKFQQEQARYFFGYTKGKSQDRSRPGNEAIAATHECKVFDAELHHLKKQKEKAEELQGNLRDFQKTVDASKAEITRIKSELSPLEERLQELNDMYEQVTTLERRIAELESGKKELKRSQEELARKIEHQFKGTVEELRRLYEEHHSQLERKGQELREAERQHETVCKGEEEIKNQLTDCLQEHGRLQTEDKHHRSRVQSRDRRIHTLADRLKLEDVGRASLSPREVRDFLARVASIRKTKEESAKQEKQSYVTQERSLQERLNDLHGNLARLEQSHKMRGKTVEENKRKMADISRELASIGSGGVALEGIERELGNATQELSEHQAAVDIPALERALAAMGDEKRRADERVSVLQGELDRISQQSRTWGALEALRKDKRGKEEQYQNEMEALEAELLSLMGCMPGAEENLEGRLTEMERSKGQELKRVVEQFRKDSSLLSRLAAQKEEAMKQLSTKRNKMEALQAEVADVCGDSNYEEAAESLQEQVATTTDDYSTVKGSQSFFRRSLEKVHATKKCPLCSRGFESDSGLELTIRSITSRLNESIPKLLPQLYDKLQSLQEKQKLLQQLRPKIEELTHLRTVEVPQLESTVEDRSKRMEKLQQEAKKAEDEQSHLRSELERIRALQPNVTRVSQLQISLKELDEKISVESSKLGGGDTSRSQLTVRRELQDALMKVDELNRKMDHKRQEISSNQQALRRLENTVHRLKEEKLKLQERLQKRQGLVTKKGELAAEIETCEREMKTDAHKLGPVQEKITQLEEEKRQVIREREETEALNRVEVDGLRATEGAIQEDTQHIKRYTSSGAESALQRCVERLGELQRQSGERGQERKELEERIKALQKQLANTKVREHELEDNLQLLRQQREVQEKEAELQRLREDLRHRGLDRYEDEYRRLQRETDRLIKEQARVEGHKLGREDQVRHMQRELQEDIYKEADSRHRDMLIRLRTTQMATTDLEKYYKALDRAITRYHKLKMEDINKIIKELWIKTYRGGDIDTIEIRSDDEMEESGTIKARRVYHYRVVMIKGEIVLDMRGRCSAGQKVLASLIIRLALAETFCINCGLLALDEPTTNLDHENVEGLAQALADIVKERSQQKNFQLMVITHDEAFVELLGHSGYADWFYRVSKEVGECSQIRRCAFSGQAP